MRDFGTWLDRGRKWLLLGAACTALAGCEASREAEAEQIERDILATPNAKQLWRTIKDEYPQDFDALVARLQDLDYPERGDKARVEQIAADWLRDFFERVTPYAVQAPASELIAWSTSESELYEVLQRGAVDDCAAMTMGEWIYIEESNAAATAAIARRNAAMVRASAAGKANPQVYEEPSEEAFTVYGDAIAATGIAPELQETLGSEAAMLALSAEEQCEIGVAVYRGLSDLPDDLEPPMAAYMLSPE